MSEKRSLTPAQIQYLRIGPKVCNSTVATKHLQQNLDQFSIEGVEPATSLSHIPKFTFGNFQKTVSNFGVLLHHNFVGSTTLHQAQKYGNVAIKMDKFMQQEKDKPSEDRKNSHKKTYADTRTALKAIHEYKGNKLLLTLKSFTVQATQTHRLMQTLPMVFLKLLVSHVPSSKLLKTIENSMKQEGSTITIDYDKMQSKAGHSPNVEIKYQQGPYQFQRSGQELTLTLPHLQILHSETEFKQAVILDNKDIMEIIDSDFDNAETILSKYFDFLTFDEHLGKTGIDPHTIPPFEDDDEHGLF